MSEPLLFFAKFNLLLHLSSEFHRVRNQFEWFWGTARAANHNGAVSKDAAKQALVNPNALNLREEQFESTAADQSRLVTLGHPRRQATEMAITNKRVLMPGGVSALDADARARSYFPLATSSRVAAESSVDNGLLSSSRIIC
jgi:hypothetical protein